MKKTASVVNAEERIGLDPDPEEMRALGYAAIDWLVEHWSGLHEKPVANLHATDAVRKELSESLPDEGRDLADSLELVGRRIVPKMTQTSHPRFHAYIPTPGSFYGTLGMLLAGGLNPFVGSSLGGASFSALELETLRWVAQAVGYPEDADGIFTSGGSMANLGALAAARAVADADGEARENTVVYVSSQGHASMNKAALVLGFDSSQIRPVAIDDDLRIDPEAFADAVEADRSAGRRPLFLCANAGTTNTGVVDPLPELAELCEGHSVWFHVDGAYGGFAAISDRAKPLLSGMDRADSLTLDPHKWLYSPMGHGCLLVRRRGALAAAFSASGDYLRDVPREEVNFFDRGPELSRPTRALPIWLLMRSVGLSALRREIDADLDLAQLAEQLIGEAPEFEIVSLHLSIVVFRLTARAGESEEDRGQREIDLVQSLLQGGDTLVSGTTLNGKSALRLVVMNHRSSAREVERSVASLRAAAGC